jgi:DNA-binding XRE family transcriptional regulator
VKTPHIKINIQGAVSKRLLKVLKEDYGDKVVIEDDEFEFAQNMDWYKKAKANMMPNDYMLAYRESRGITQAKLGMMLGGLSRQHISDIENGRRQVSKEIAKKLARIFNTSVDKFI